MNNFLDEVLPYFLAPVIFIACWLMPRLQAKGN